MLKPAWQSDAALGVKSIVPGNSARGLASVVPIYLLFDPVTGALTNIMDGRALALSRSELPPRRVCYRRG